MNKRGRPRKPEEERRKCIAISMDPGTMEDLKWLTKNLDMKPSSAIKYLIRQAKKDQVLRNIIKNNQVADLRAKSRVAWLETKTSGYITTQNKDGSLFTVYRDPNKTVQDDYEEQQKLMQIATSKWIDEEDEYECFK